MSNDALESALRDERGGVWFAPAVEARKVESLAKKAKFTYFHVDGKSVQRKEQLMNSLATTLALPGHFGHNWDALEECLMDLDGDGTNGYLLLYEHIDGLLEAHPDQFATFLEILRDAVASWKEDDTAMIVVLTGAKAPPGVERLKA